MEAEATGKVIAGDMTWNIEQGNVLDYLRSLPDRCVHCVVTSPPYWNLRDYCTGKWEGGDPKCRHLRRRSRNDAGGAFRPGAEEPEKIQYVGICPTCGAKRIDDQIGLEGTPAEYVAKMVEVFREVRRVLRDDGVCFLNLGDSYSGNSKKGASDPGKNSKHLGNREKTKQTRALSDPLPSGNLVGIPWRVAFALQDDGWILRQDIIWSKPGPMPESVKNRCTKSHEYVFLLVKRMGYFWDGVAIKEKQKSVYSSSSFLPNSDKDRYGDKRTAATGASKNNRSDDPIVDRYANKRSVWTVSFQPWSEAHFATFPPKLVEPMIKAGSSERGCCRRCGAPHRRLVEEKKLKRDCPNDFVKRTGEEGTGNRCRDSTAGVESITIGWEKTCNCKTSKVIPCLVLDPFSGAGTTVMVARRLRRRGIGCDLNKKYVRMARRRVKMDSPLFN